MSGVAIDFESTGSASARKDIDGIHLALQKLIKSSNDSNAALNKLSVKNISKDAKANSTALEDMGGKGKVAFENTSSAAKDTANSFLGLKVLVGALGASFIALQGIRALSRFSDDLVSIQNSLKLVTKDSDDLFRTQSKLYKLSIASRSGFGATIGIYTDLNKSMAKYGLSQERILKVTKTIQQASALSSGSQQSKEMGLVQLSQGLGSALQGQELRSVFEQLNYLGFSMQETFKMTAGEMIKFAETGALSGMKLIEMFDKMASKTDYDFQKTVITIDTAMAQMSQAFSMFFGNLAQHYGFTAAFSSMIFGISKVVNNLNDSFISQMYILSQTFKNYINQFSTFSSLELTIKSVLNLEISPLKSLDKLKQINKIKSYLNKFQETLGMTKTFKVKGDITGFGDLLPNFEKDKTVTNAISEVKTLREKLTEIIDLGKTFYDSIALSFENIGRLVPIMIGPMLTYFSSFKVFIFGIIADFKSFLYLGLMPTIRQIEDTLGLITFFAFSKDNRLENSFTRLFNSDGIVEFKKNLEALNKLRGKAKWDDFGYLFNESVVRPIKYAILPIQDFLIKLGLMENQLIRVRDTRLDRVLKYFEYFGRSVERVYKDIFAPRIEKNLTKISVFAEEIAKTFVSAFTKSINETSGEQFALSLVRGIKGSFEELISFIKQIFNGEKTFKDFFITSKFNFFVESVKKIFISLGLFIKGFFSGLFKGIFSKEEVDTSFSSKLFKATTDGVNEGIDSLKKTFNSIFGVTSDTLVKTESRISKFGKHVKDVFKDIYEEVVGHSFWPDTMNGVSDSTGTLDSVINKIKSFKEKVTKVLSDLYANMMEKDTHKNNPFESIVDSVSSIDWKATFSRLTLSISSAILAGFMFVFNGGVLSVIATSYFISVFDFAIGSALSSIIPKIGVFIGSALGDMVAKLMMSLSRGLNILVIAVPQFIKSFIAGLNPIGSYLVDLGSFLPGWLQNIFSVLISFSNTTLSVFSYVNNSLIHGLVGIGAAYAMFAKGGFGTVYDIIFGKAGKGKENLGAKDGIVDYIAAIFPSNSEGMFSKIFAKMSGPLAAAAGLAFSSALLESVSLIEASTVGVPLLLFAFLGKDQGGALIANILLFSKTLTTNLLGGILQTIGKRTPIIGGLLGGLGDMLKGAGGDKKQKYKMPSNNPAILAALSLKDTLKEAYENFKYNFDDYSKKRMSLLDAFSMSSVSNNMINFKREFGKFFSTILDMPLGSTSLRVFTTFLSDAKGDFSKVFKAIKDIVIINSQAIWGALSSFVLGFRKILSSGISTIFSSMSAGFMAFGLVAILLFKSFEGIASASDSASGGMERMGDSGRSILGIITGITVAALALNSALKLKSAFDIGKASFISKNGASDMLGANFAGISGIGKVLLGVFERVKSVGNSAFLSLSDAFRAPGDSLIWMTENLKLFTNYISLSPLTISRLKGSLENFSTVLATLPLLSVKGKVVSLFKALSDLSINTTIAGFQFFVSVLKLCTFGIWKFITALFSLTMTLVETLLSALASVSFALLTFMAPFLAIISGVAAIGAVGLYLFGPGNNFFEKLEWSYDKIKSIFGMKSTTSFGRENQIRSKDDVKVGDKIISFKADFNNIDFKALTETQFKVLDESTSATKTALSNLNELYTKQGSLTDQQLNELDRIVKEQHGINMNQPEKASSTLFEKSKELQDSILMVDNSWWLLIKRSLGWTPVLSQNALEISNVTKNLEDLNTAFGVIGASFSFLIDIIVGFKDGFNRTLHGMVSWSAAFFTIIGSIGVTLAGAFVGLPEVLGMLLVGALTDMVLDTSFVTTLGQKLKDYVFPPKAPENDALNKADDVNKNTDLLKRFESDIPGEMKLKLDKAFADAKAASDKVSQVRAYGIHGSKEENAKFFNEGGLDALLKEEAARLLELNTLKEEVTQLTIGSYRSRLLNSELTNIITNAKDLAEIDLGKSFAGSYLDMERLKSIFDEITKLKLIKPETLTENSDIIFKTEELKKKAKAITDAVSAKLSLESKVELQFKISDESISPEALKSLQIKQPKYYDPEKGSITREGYKIPIDPKGLPSDKRNFSEYFSSKDGKNYNEFTSAKFALDSLLESLKKVDTTPIDTLFDKISNAKIAYENALSSGANEETLSKKLVELTDFKMKLLSKTPVTTWLDDLNFQLKRFNLDEIKQFNYAFSDQTSLLSMASAIEGVRLAYLNLDNLKLSPEDDPGLLKKTKALRDYLLAINGVKIAQLGMTSSNLKAIKDLNVSPSTKDALSSSILGIESSKNAKEKGKTGELALAQTDLYEAQRNIKILQDAETRVNQPAFKAEIDVYMDKEAKAQKKIDDINKVSEKVSLTLDNIISKLNETGEEISIITFSHLALDAQEYLATMGSQLDAFDKQISTALESGLPIGDIIKEKMAVLEKTGAKLSEILRNTGAGVSKLFTQAGVSDARDIEKLYGTAIGDTVMNIGEQIKAIERRNRSERDGTQAYISNLAEIERLKKTQTSIKDKGLLNIETASGFINDVFKTSFDSFDLSTFAPSIYKGMASLAIDLKENLEKAIQGGFSTTDIFSRMRDLAKTGSMLTFFKDVMKSTEEALTEGAKSAFEKFKSVVGDGVSFLSYMKMPNEERRSIAKQLSDNAMVAKILNSPNLSSDQVKVLNSSQSDSAILEQLQTLGWEDLQKQLQSPVEETAKNTSDMVTSLKNIENAFVKPTYGPQQDTANAFQFPYSPEFMASSKYFSSGVSASDTPNGAAFKRNEDVPKALTVDQTRKMFLDSNPYNALGKNSGLDERTQNLASDAQLKEANRIGKAIFENDQLINAARISGNTDTVRKLQIANEDYSHEISRISTRINDSAKMVQEAGTNFASSLQSNITSALGDLFRGKAEEGKSPFQTFADNLLNNFTSTILDTFTKTLTDELFKGVFGSFFESIGGLIAKGVSQMGSQVAASGAFDWVGAGINLFGAALGLAGGASEINNWGGGTAGVSTAGFNNPANLGWHAAGGSIYGPGSPTSDSIPAMLSNKEFVVNAKQAELHRPMLEALNKGRIKRLAQGGAVSGISRSPMIPGMYDKSQSRSNQQIINLTITGDISKQTKKEIYSMLPTIASGVNSINKEKGYRG